MMYSQLQFEDLVMENSTECKDISQVYNSSLKSSSNNTNRFVVKEHLLEKILDKSNIRIAMKRVIKNKGAERVRESITTFIEGTLKLKVNKEKTVVAYATNDKFLGFGFYFNKEAKVRVHRTTVKKMKNQIRFLLKKTRGHISNEVCTLDLKRYIMGWVNYFKIANMKRLLESIDKWMRRKIRCRIWKQWKKIKTRYQKP